MMAMRNNERTIVGDLLASAKGIDKLFTQIQSLQAHMGRARTTRSGDPRDDSMAGSHRFDFWSVRGDPTPHLTLE